MRKLLLGISAAAAAAAVPTVSASAVAHDRHDRGDRYERYYDRDGGYHGPTWRGRDGRYYCRKPNGTTGMIVGGAAGALLGREIDGGRDRTTGTIVGAALGALVGRAVHREVKSCR